MWVLAWFDWAQQGFAFPPQGYLFESVFLTDDTLVLSL